MVDGIDSVDNELLTIELHVKIGQERRRRIIIKGEQLWRIAVLYFKGRYRCLSGNRLSQSLHGSRGVQCDRAASARRRPDAYSHAELQELEDRSHIREGSWMIGTPPGTSVNFSLLILPHRIPRSAEEGQRLTNAASYTLRFGWMSSARLWLPGWMREQVIYHPGIGIFDGVPGECRPESVRSSLLPPRPL